VTDRGSGYLRSERRLWQLRQRKIRSAGYGPELRWSVKCFIGPPQSLQAGAGTSSGLVAESGIVDNRWQISRIAAVQFETFFENKTPPKVVYLATAPFDEFNKGQGLRWPRATVRAAYVGATN
jgi:hypothetical protein